MTAVATVACLDCGQPIEGRTAGGNAPSYCGPCKRRHKEFAARNAEQRARGARTTEAELALTVSEQRLHIEEAAALMSMAVLRHDWFLVDCALDELQGVDRLADVRRHLRAGAA